MNKKIIALFLVTLAVLPAIAMAASSKLTITPYGSLTGYKYGTGKIIVNNPKGAVNFILELMLKKATPSHTYYVYAWVDQDWTNLNWDNLFQLGSFTTNKQGNGNFHFNNAGQLLPIASLPTGEHKFKFVITDDNLGDQAQPTEWTQPIQGQSAYVSDWTQLMQINKIKSK